MSDSVRPEIAAFAELEQLVKHLGDELAAFRRRALQAEARLKGLETTGSKGVVSPERVQYLETRERRPQHSARSRARADAADDRSRAIPPPAARRGGRT